MWILETIPEGGNAWETASDKTFNTAYEARCLARLLAQQRIVWRAFPHYWSGRAVRADMTNWRVRKQEE